MTKATPTILVICGPTASGKTSLALSIASYLTSDICDLQSSPVRILSVDSRQIYQGLDLVTGKDIPKDLPSNIHFYGLDLIPADQTMNLSEFVQYAKPIILQSIEECIPLIIVGGTGLYLKALTQTLSNLSTPPNAALRADLEKLNTEELKKMLFELNSDKYHSMNNSDVNNPRRLIRAIEISKASQTQQSPPVIPGLTRNLYRLPPTNFHKVGLRPDPEIQKQKIRQRVLDRIEQGALEEVENLLKKYPNKNLPLFTSLGVKEIIQHLDNQITRGQLIDLWTNAEIDYARRQVVWFKKQPEIIWYDKVNQILASQLAKTIQKNA